MITVRVPATIPGASHLPLASMRSASPFRFMPASVSKRRIPGS
jgi:hypothetical protein